MIPPSRHEEERFAVATNAIRIVPSLKDRLPAS
jgi:hypothetical protein